MVAGSGQHSLWLSLVHQMLWLLQQRLRGEVEHPLEQAVTKAKASTEHDVPIMEELRKCFAEEQLP